MFTYKDKKAPILDGNPSSVEDMMFIKEQIFNTNQNLFFTNVTKAIMEIIEKCALSKDGLRKGIIYIDLSTNKNQDMQHLLTKFPENEHLLKIKSLKTRLNVLEKILERQPSLLDSVRIAYEKLRHQLKDEYNKALQEYSITKNKKILALSNYVYFLILEYMQNNKDHFRNYQIPIPNSLEETTASLQATNGPEIIEYQTYLENSIMQEGTKINDHKVTVVFADLQNVYNPLIQETLNQYISSICRVVFLTQISKIASYTYPGKTENIIDGNCQSYDLNETRDSLIMKKSV